eukprot:5365152-Prymnesium_polylepis.1
MSTSPIVRTSFDITVRRKNGYCLPSLRCTDVEEGETIGTWYPADICEADWVATEQPAPTIASTPAPPLSWGRRRWSAPKKPRWLLHFESAITNARRV